MSDDLILPRTGWSSMSRRKALGVLGAAAASSLAIPREVLAEMGADGEELIRSHGYSFFGDLKYPDDFKHFDYVNPNAPKGGQIKLATRGTFDGFNRWAQRGNAESDSSIIGESMFGEMPWGSGLPADSLTDSYCLIAKEVEYPKNKTWCVFHMRDDVVFRDGSPLKASDAKFTMELFLEQGIRSYRRAVSERIASIEVIDDHTIRYNFEDETSRRSLVEIVGGVPILSEAWYKETGERLDEPSVNSPMGSGPYQVGDYEFNRYVVYERNPNYWGWDHPANVGRHNFDSVRVEYFADSTAEFEAFKTGVYHIRTETSPKRWVTGYDFPAIQAKDAKIEEIPKQTAPTNSGIIYNTLKSPLDNRAVREALTLGYNDDWVRESLQFSLTTQRHSFAEGEAWEATGVPEGAELEFLKSLGDAIEPEMLTAEVIRAHESNPRNPVDRRNQRKALKMLADEGWSVNDQGTMVNGEGEQLVLDFLVLATWDETRQAVIQTYAQTLRSWGIEVNAEKVDSAQGQQRFLDKDYHVLPFRYGTFATIGTGLKQQFGGETAEVSSYNSAALRSTAVDAIIDAALEAKSREEEIVAMTALDRALRFERVMAHQGYIPNTWVAYYDMFGRPDELPPLAIGVLDFWWMDKDRNEALKAKGAIT